MKFKFLTACLQSPPYKGLTGQRIGGSESTIPKNDDPTTGLRVQLEEIWDDAGEPILCNVQLE